MRKGTGHLPFISFCTNDAQNYFVVDETLE